MEKANIEKLKTEKSELISKYISLKKDHQELYFKHQEIISENIRLKKQLIDFQTKNSELEKEKNEKNEKKDGPIVTKSILRENRNLLAQVKQMKRISSPIATPKRETAKLDSTGTPKKTPVKPKLDSEVFEVEEIIKHRGRSRNREFLVRWKGFGKDSDSWEKQKNLSCPIILKKYFKNHNLK